VKTLNELTQETSFYSNEYSENDIGIELEVSEEAD
jgi:hypothetical protein